MSMQLRALQPLVNLIVKGGFVLALAVGAIGVILVYLGSSGDAEISIFGQSIKSQNVGVSALFLSVVMIIILIRRVLSTVDTTTKIEAKSEAPEVHGELLKKHIGNKVSAVRKIKEDKNC